MEGKLKEIIPKLKALALEKGIEELSVKGTTAYVYRSKVFNEDPSLQITGKFRYEKKEGKAEFEATANKLLEEAAIQAEVEIEPLFKGMKFPTIAKVTSVLNKAEGEKDLAPAAGEVILYDFWATWCGPCQHPMGHNQEMLASHPEWKGKARIIGVSIDDGIEAPLKRVTEKKWTDVEHYWVAGGWGSEIAKTLSIHGIPFCVLVDKHGLVALAGHPSSMDLEKNIPKLINGETLASKGEEGEAGPGEVSMKDATFTYEACKTEMDNFVKTIGDAKDALPGFLMAGVYNTNYMKVGDAGVSSFLVVRYQWGKKKQDAAKLVKDKINEVFGPKIDIKLQDQEIPEKSIEMGSSCNKCAKSIMGDDQYLCYCCSPAVYFCKDCVESVKAAKATELVHPHTLYYIQKESTGHLDAIRYYTFKVVKEDAAEKMHGGVGCDSCGGSVSGVRWKCGNCFNVDICETCFGIAREPANPKLEALQKKASGVGHDMKKHVYVRLDFSDWTDLHA